MRTIPRGRIEVVELDDTVVGRTVAAARIVVQSTRADVAAAQSESAIVDVQEAEAHDR